MTAQSVAVARYSALELVLMVDGVAISAELDCMYLHTQLVAIDEE